MVGVKRCAPVKWCAPTEERRVPDDNYTSQETDARGLCSRTPTPALRDAGGPASLRLGLFLREVPGCSPVKRARSPQKRERAANREEPRFAALSSLSQNPLPQGSSGSSPGSRTRHSCPGHLRMGTHHGAVAAVGRRRERSCLADRVSVRAFPEPRERPFRLHPPDRDLVRTDRGFVLASERKPPREF